MDDGFTRFHKPGTKMANDLTTFCQPTKVTSAQIAANLPHLFVKLKKIRIPEQIGMNSAFNYWQKPYAAILSPRSYRQIQSLLTRYFMACIRRQLRWVVLKPTTAKRKKCPSAALKIPNNRKNAAFLKNQAMNIAVCILFLMNTAIVLKRRYKPTGESPDWIKSRC